MKRTALLAAFLLAAHTASAQPLVFDDVTVIDVEQGVARPGMRVVVVGDRIVAVGEAGEVEVPAGASVVEAKGQYLIPGLWDMHVHVGGDPLARQVILPLFVAHGVTGVREMSGHPPHLALKNEVASGTAVGPRLVVGGLVDGPNGGAGMPFVPAVDAAQGRAAVDAVRAAGYDFVKTYTWLPEEAYRGIQTRARELDMEVSGHVPMTVSLEEAVDLGHRTLEHLVGVEFACSEQEDELRRGYREEVAALAVDSTLDTHAELFVRSEWEPLPGIDPERCREVHQRLAASDVWVVPTLIRQNLVSHRYEAPILKHPLGQALAGFLNPEQVWGMDPERRLLPVYEHRVKSIGDLHEAGVDMLAGSDLPGGLPLHYELRLLVEGGLSPLEALRTATLNPARYLGIVDSLGTVAPGKRADLVLLGGNPLEDITHTERIAGVVLGGRFLDRGALDQMLAGVMSAVQSEREP